jgi:hypothetical protein
VLTQLEKHLLLALACLTWVALLVFLALFQFGGDIPQRPALPTFAFRSYKSVKTSAITELLSGSVYQRLKPAVNQANPFYCIQLFPPSAPPPKNRTIDLVYRGFFLTSHGEKHGYVMADNKLIVGLVGAKVTANLTIADMNPAGLTLKDAAGKETFLPFNTKQTVNVPVQ